MLHQSSWLKRIYCTVLCSEITEFSIKSRAIAISDDGSTRTVFIVQNTEHFNQYNTVYHYSKNSIIKYLDCMICIDKLIAVFNPSKRVKYCYL